VPAVAAAPRRGWLQLRFAGDLESEFRTTSRASMRRWVSMSMVVALSTVIGFAIIDHWVLVGPRVRELDVFRFGVQLPLVLGMLALTSERYYGRWYQPAIQICAPLFALGHVLMAMQATPEQLPLIVGRLVLVIFFFYFMLGMSFHAALRSNAVLLTAYIVAAIAGAVPPNVATYQTFVMMCANLIGAAGCFALEHANRVAFLERRRLADVAAHDGLTGLLNRTALEDQVRNLWPHAERQRMAVSVLLIDIDHFKAYNDRYGHQAGDRCLCKVAVAVREAAARRPLDFVARYGGEEIIAVLFGAERTHGENVAAAVVEAVDSLRVPHLASGTQPYVTVSVGVTTIDPTMDYSHDLAVQRADRALYAAKSQGRNGWAASDDLAEVAELQFGREEVFRTGS